MWNVLSPSINFKEKAWSEPARNLAVTGNDDETDEVINSMIRSVIAASIVAAAAGIATSAQAAATYNIFMCDGTRCVDLGVTGGFYEDMRGPLSEGLGLAAAFSRQDCIREQRRLSSANPNARYVCAEMTTPDYEWDPVR